MHDADHIVALDVLAKRLGISQRWLRKETDAGRIPFLKAGARRLYNIEAVAQSLAERAACSDEPSAEQQGERR